MIRRSLIMLAVACFGINAWAGDKVAVSLEGDALAGKIGRITAAGQIEIGGQMESLEGLREIFSVDATATMAVSEAEFELILVNGSRFRALSLTLEDEDFLAKTEKLGEVRIPIDLVRAARFREGFREPRFDDAAARSIEESENDTFFLVQDKGEVLEVAGFVESIDPEKIVFEREETGKLEDVVPARLHGIVFVTPWREKGPGPAYRVTLVDGSRLAGAALKREADGPLEVEVAAGLQFSVPWEDVRRIGIRSPRLLYLSDADPKFTKAKTILSLEREWRRDESVTASPLRMGQRIFEKGLGVASGMRLDFDCTDYDRFVAVLGLDATANGRGDCEFVVRVDGEEVSRERLRSSSPLLPLKIDVAGKQTLSLVVEPGADLDLSDYANWGDASLVQLR